MKNRISIALCREFIRTIEGFFDRVFASLDLPPRFRARAAEDADWREARGGPYRLDN